MSTSLDTSILARAGVADSTIHSGRDTYYPMQAWYCIGLFLFIIGVFQWTSVFYSKLAGMRSIRGGDPELADGSRSRKFSFSRIAVALTNAYRVIAFRWTLEFGKSYTLNMAEVFMTIAYVAFLYVWAFINTTNLEGDKLAWRYWWDRAGTLASSQFPLITALGTKNNLVSLVTGISYDKLSYIHRMATRVVFVLLWVHGGSEIVHKSKFDPEFTETWLLCGIVSLAALSILCIISLRPVRAGAYEFFFYAHFALVAIFLACAYIHDQDNEYGYWIYPCFAIWGLDRLLRLVRLIVFNHSYFGFHSGATMDATAELLSEDFVRLRCHRPPHFRWTPGQTAYLIMPSVSRLPFEAHPFTIASFDSDLFSSVEQDKTFKDTNNQRSLAKHALGSGAPFWKELVFFINVRGGFTACLKEAALARRKVKVFVDGPYGPSPDLGSYDTSVLIAGGSGVSYTLPTLLDIIEKVREGKSNCRRVVFIWAIRDANHIHWIDDTVIRALHLVPPSLSVSIHIHVTGVPVTTESLPRLEDHSEKTREDPNSDIIENQDGKAVEKNKDVLNSMEAVKVENGRPNLPAILREEVECATGRMSVSVCGSHGIARSVRHALRFPVSSPLNVLRGGPSVTLHVESFGYA
ncbi:hypothetical protein PAXRUDRAFT_162169 [Paxillus rubicundulus Ve08.2h10]|uniref:FAD-binding FR-type domain-containing protein n=1 Tax=Paxillus rubicundulus Ve08.2h10 TaxID=930991 RepID=A0A0D0CUI9_9AGAM|nr:hypothetical protein PAXRUDRAFT_162169 [Paxillus rubicundulus Ve08.2h10]